MKLSEITDKFIIDTEQILRYSATEMGYDFENIQKLQEEVNRLYLQENTFNSVFIVDTDANILVNAPQSLGVTGKKAVSKQASEGLQKGQAFISDPYISPTGRELIVLSTPIYDKEGSFKGVVNGTIYLHESNIFELVLGQHPYGTGSYVYVVDTLGKIIYHPNNARLGEDVSQNEVVAQLLEKKNGALSIVNSQGQPMLAGFSATEKTRWGIVVQTPYDQALSAVGKQVMNVFIIGLPFIFLSTIFVFFLATRIVRPLQNMAEIAGNSAQEQEMKKLKDIRAWYVEVYKIQEALIQSFSILHGKVNTLKEESATDPLTKLLNRRSFENYLSIHTDQQQSYTLVILDVDWFKAINDTYGHLAGDEILRRLAENIKESLEEDEVACRYGGEEFVLVFLETSIDQAYERVEALRKEFAQLSSLTEEPITFSAGIANFPLHGDNPQTVLEKADVALYKAKKDGRNRVEVAGR